jgi:CheY-like chemotaxis protein
MAAGKVLVVDDLPDWQKTLSGLLRDNGYEVKAVGAIDTALQALEHEYFNVAILDVRLDESNEDNQDGLALMRQIKERWPSVEIIILTGYAKVSMAQKALNADAGGDRYAHSFLEKTQTNELIKQVKKACEKSIEAVNFLISHGELETVEFKSSIRWDYRKGEVNKEMQVVIAKSIAGMLNCRGGTLLIGVADDGTILGIDKDLTGLPKPDTDGFQLLLTEVIRNYLGLEYMQYILVRFEEVHDKSICVISIRPSNRPVFVSSGSRSEFWLRTGNATRQMDIKEATGYIESHWGRR